jgi:hypothetical protein
MHEIPSPAAGLLGRARSVVECIRMYRPGGVQVGWEVRRRGLDMRCGHLPLGEAR